jgi:hypothetical protein
MNEYRTIRNTVSAKFDEAMGAVDEGDTFARSAIIAGLIRWSQTLPPYESGYIHGRIVEVLKKREAANA